MSQDLMESKISGYQILEKIVKAAGHSGHIYLPPEWIGKRVKVVLIEPLTAEREKGE
jgi:hypothetical protein